MLAPFITIAVLSAEPVEAGLEGSWQNPGASVVVAIAPCGEALCGRVSWASEKAKVDARKGGTDPLVGAELLTGFVRKGPDSWRGRLFVPDINQHSKAEITWLSAGQLKVTGCAIAGLVCKSQVWTRAMVE